MVDDTGLEIMMPENAPVRLTSAQLEELDYRKLYSAYSPTGRKSVVDPRVMFKVLVYGYQCGIYSSRKLEEACRYRIDFMWLLDDAKTPDHTTFSRFRKRCSAVVEELFTEYVQKLERMGDTDHRSVFIDGTKLESRAGRYSFCWRGSTEKHLARMKEKVQAQLARQAAEIAFVHGIGHRKTAQQREWETLSELCKRWEGYEASLRIMGESRNSYSKTDPDATFMRMKEDHMRNGQLKPAYNVQLAVNSEYITGLDVFSNRTDFETLKPFLRRLEQLQRARYEEVVADAGCESLENYLYLESTGQTCFLKPANHEQKKTSKFKKQIGRIENMSYDAEGDFFTYAEGRKLSLRREQSEPQEGQFVTTAWYRCEDCCNCPQRAACCKAADTNRPKELELRRTFWEKWAQAEEQICSKRGIHLLLCRSIQVAVIIGLSL